MLLLLVVTETPGVGKSTVCNGFSGFDRNFQLLGNSWSFSTAPLDNVDRARRDFIKALYDNALRRPADSDGLEYWANQMTCPAYDSGAQIGQGRHLVYNFYHSGGELDQQMDYGLYGQNSLNGVSGRIRRLFKGGPGYYPSAGNMNYWYSYIAGAPNLTQRIARWNWAVYTIVHLAEFETRIGYGGQDDHPLCFS